MEPDAIVVANPDWFTPFAVAAMLQLTAFFVWAMQALVNSKIMVGTVLAVGILAGISKLIDPMLHRILSSALLVVLLGFSIYVTWETWPRLKWMSLANAILLPVTAVTGYLLFIG